MTHSPPPPTTSTTKTHSVLGKHNMQKIVDYVRQGHNVVLLANHQVRR